MEIRLNNGQAMNVQAPKYTCDKCANGDFARTSNTGFPICTATGKSVLSERDRDGSCGRDGLNYKPKDR